eukprot:TRINITY_DN28749_c0_g1_i1.p1 TRINITY_DN28749_c0_g1~~TRINITY_DN28749_c0_g1_i1.p1  ORF type:complete len:196 (-),score=46.72 TRINITY_DN28749_c0_g1_i1:63-650(-)
MPARVDEAWSRRLAGLNLVKCLDLDGSGQIDCAVLSRSLKAFDADVFTDSLLENTLGPLQRPRGDSNYVSVDAVVALVSTTVETEGADEESRPATAASIASVLDAERLEDLMRRGSTASGAGSDFDGLRETAERLAADADAEGAADPESLERTRKLLDEGAGLREERQRLMEEHLQLKAAAAARASKTSEGLVDR